LTRCVTRSIWPTGCISREWDFVCCFPSCGRWRSWLRLRYRRPPGWFVIGSGKGKLSREESKLNEQSKINPQIYLCVPWFYFPGPRLHAAAQLYKARPVGYRAPEGGG